MVTTKQKSTEDMKGTKKMNPNKTLKNKSKPQGKMSGENKERKNYKSNKNGNNYILIIITLNVNGLNAWIKSHRVAECIKKHDPSTFCL